MKKLSLKTKKRIKGILATILVIAISATVFINSGFFSNALFNSKDAVTYAAFKNKVKVENSVLFIGTYIIHINAMTRDIYSKALDSASDSGQNSIYYKSEISEGQWFEIDNIDNGLKGISDGGVPVDDAVLDPLYVTYYAGADGILKDAKNLAAINSFDIPDPYDLSKLPELQPLWLQYTYSEQASDISQSDFLKNRNSEETGNLRSDVYSYQLLSTFFSLDLRDAETNKCDEDLAKLNNLYIQLKGAGKDDEAELVYGLMEKVDAKRRMLVMERLIVLDPNLLNILNTLAGGSNYTTQGDFKDSSSDDDKSSNPDYINELEDSTKHDFSASSLANTNPWVLSWFNILGITGNSDGWWTVLEDQDEDEKIPFSVDTSVLEAIGTCMSKCSDSYTQYQSMCLAADDDILGQAIYEYSMQVIEASSSSGLGGPITQLKHVVNIQNGRIKDEEGELNMLKDNLISRAYSVYSINACAGPNADYNSKKTRNAKKAALEEQKTSLEMDRDMLQGLIDALRKRAKAPEALAFVQERLKEAEALKKSIPKNAFRSYANSSVEAYIVWLKKEARMIIDSDKSLKSEADNLKDKKEELQKKRDAALDDNDLSGAKAYDAMIEAVDRDIADAEGGGSSSGSSADNLTDGLIDKAMNKLADNADADLSGIADALAAMGADDKLDELKEKAAESGASDSTLRGIQDAIDSLNDGSGGNAATEDALLAALEEFFGKSLDELSDRELAIACASMSKVAKSGIKPAGSLTSKLVTRMQTSKNKFLYSQYGNEMSVEYVNLKTISDCTQYRYFFDEDKATATVTSGSKIRIFKRSSDQMHKGSVESDPETMKNKTVSQNDLMISEEDAKTYFNCIAEYAYDTDYAVCVTGPMQSAVDDCVEALTAFMKGE